MQFYINSTIPCDVFDIAWMSICKGANLDPKKLRPIDRIEDFVRRNPPWETMGDEWEDVSSMWNFRAKRLGIVVDWQLFENVDGIVRLAVECIQREKTTAANQGM
jgi:hypothetical protein